MGLQTGMSQRDAFDRTLAALYEAMFDDARWPSASALVDEACRIQGNMLVYGTGSAEPDIEVWMARLLYRGERNEALERRYFEEYYALDERVPRLRSLADSQLVHVSDLYTDEEKKASAVWNEALPLSNTQDSLSVRLDGPNGSRIVWSFADSIDGKGWSFNQVDMIERLLPSLRQYIRVRQAVSDADGLATSLTHLLETSRLGIVQLDRRGRIVAVNGQALGLLRIQCGLCDRDGYLHASQTADDSRLQGLLAQALDPAGQAGVSGSMAVHRPGRRSRLVVHVTPVGARLHDSPAPLPRVAALVLVIDPQRRLPVSSGLVETALGLTPGESQIALLLADGYTVQKIIKMTGRSENTIRWHMRQTFQKLGIERQVQLVQLVRSLSGISAPTPDPAPSAAARAKRKKRSS